MNDESRCIGPSFIIHHSSSSFQLDCHFRVQARAEDPGAVFLAVLHFGPDQELPAGLDQRLDVDDLAGEGLASVRGRASRRLTGRPWISEGW